MTNYRLKLLSGNHAIFIFRRDGEVRCVHANLAPTSLSYLVGEKAAELLFNLEDASDANQALQAVRAVIERYEVSVI